MLCNRTRFWILWFPCGSPHLFSIVCESTLYRQYKAISKVTLDNRLNFPLGITLHLTPKSLLKHNEIINCFDWTKKFMDCCILDPYFNFQNQQIFNKGFYIRNLLLYHTICMNIDIIKCNTVVSNHVNSDHVPSFSCHDVWNVRQTTCTSGVWAITVTRSTYSRRFSRFLINWNMETPRKWLSKYWCSVPHCLFDNRSISRQVVFLSWCWQQ